MQYFSIAEKTSFPELPMALQAMREDGIVCLKQAVSIDAITALQNKMQEDLSAFETDRSKNKWNSLRPPPFHPFLFSDVIYNPYAIEICRGLLGPHATLTTYGANTAWPEQVKSQPIHRDVVDGPITDRCPAVVLNFPLTEFTSRNGPTTIYPGSHQSSVAAANGTRIYSQEMLDKQAYQRPSELTTGIGPGDLVIRDLRLWHGGTPNLSNERRTMLALVVIDPAYTEQDETSFKGFEAEAGTESFWQHPRLATSVAFVPPGDRSYYLQPHHSTPPTPLYLDWLRRKGEK